MGWMHWSSNLSGGKVLCTSPDGLQGPPSIWVSFPGVKQQGHSVDHLHQSSAEVKERIELYFYLLCAFMASYKVNFTFISIMIMC
jgi:hypothetical protein